MSTHSLDNLFSILSKVIIFVPLGAIIIVLFIKLGQSAVVAPSQVTLSPSPAPSPTVVKKEATASAKLDLEGPYRCSYQTSDATTSAYIKNKNVSIEVESKKEVSNAVLKGDCLYTWDTNEIDGKKVCGLSSVVSMFETFSRFNLFDISKIFEFIPKSQMSDKLGTDAFDAEKIMSSCKKEEIQDSVFQIPTGVNFKLVDKEELL